MLIAVTASKHFKCNTYVALWCCLALVNGSWGEIAARIADGEEIKFIIFKMAQTTYTSTVLPPLFLVLILAYLERFLEKHVPDVIKALAVPFICAVIMVPATILIIGPVSDGLANAIATGYNTLVNAVPVLAAAIVGGAWQIFVIFGVHWGVTPMILANFQNNGCDTFQAFQTCAVVAQAAACFGVFIKTKKSEIKNVSFSAGLTGIFGITEPAIYGVTLRLKKPFIAGCIGGAAGAVIVSLFHSVYYVYAGLPGVLTTVNAIGENTSSFTGMVVGVAATIVITILLVQETVPEAGGLSEEAPEKVIQTAGNTDIYTPLNGELKPLAEVNDPTFSGEILGKGVAIIPSEGRLYAPFDGEVSMVFETKHAIGLVKDDVEMLIHVGLETVSLGGKYFDAKVKVGDKIKKGDLLLEFDLEAIAKEGFEIITPVVVSNSDDFAEIKADKTAGAAIAGEHLMIVRR